MKTLEIDEEPTAKTCPECKGEGLQRIETGTSYKVGPCAFCRGTGRVPMSGSFPAAGWLRA